MIFWGKKKSHAGILGDRLDHSRSPLIHRYWLQHYGCVGVYEKLPVAAEDFADFVRHLPERGFVGANVTLPYKQAAFALCDDSDDMAMCLQAVNTLVFKKGKIIGSNTDGYGFLAGLQEKADLADIITRPVLILGAGGAARAVVGALIMAGVKEIRISNRSHDRLTQLVRLAESMGAATQLIDWQDKSAALSDCGLLVNTTSLGMSGQPPLEMDLSPLAEDAVVYDIVYAPPETPFLRAARQRNHVCINGLDMLLYQAVPGFAAWFGITPEVSDTLRQLVLADLETGD